MELRAGSARVDITPPLSIPYLGFVPRQGRFKGVHDPLYARALVLDNGDNRIAIISADSLGYGNEILGNDRNFTAEVRQRIKKRTGLHPENIMLASTHAHSTPETLGITRLSSVPEATSWLEVLIDQLASVVELACSDMSPARLKFNTGHVKTIGHNRRTRDLSIEGQIENGLLDTQVGVLLCEIPDSGRSFVVVNFACHPVTVQVQPFVSADYPGVATGMVENVVAGCENCLFLQGAAGNINPVDDDSRDFADVRRYGMILAGEVVKVVGALQAKDAPVMKPVLAAASEELCLPFRNLPNTAPIIKAYQLALMDVEEAETDEERQKAIRKANGYKESLDYMESARKSIPAEVQVLRLGDLALASTPGEIFVQLGMEIKSKSTAPYTCVVELANGWIGYLLNPGGFAAGGYEAAVGPWTKVGEDSGQMLVEKALELIEKLWN